MVRHEFSAFGIVPVSIRIVVLPEANESFQSYDAVAPLANQLL